MTRVLWNISKRLLLKDTHREKVPANKIATLSKSTNMDIWVVGTSNQFFIRGSLTETKFSKNKVITDKTSFFVIVPFRIPHSICLNNVEIKVLKTLKIFSNCLIKTHRSLKRRAILKITKTNSNFAVNLAEMLKQETIHFSLFDHSHKK